jgi:phage terminase small subunit
MDHPEVKLTRPKKKTLAESPGRTPPRTRKKKSVDDPSRKKATTNRIQAKIDEGTFEHDAVADYDSTLTEQQRLFVNFLVHEQQNRTAAARLAGYVQPNQSSYELVKQPKIQRAIAEAREEYAKASQMTRKKVIDGFLEAIEMAKMKADPGVMVMGWREVGKMCGFFEPTKHKIEITHKGRVQIDRMNSLSDEELLQIAEQGDVIDGDYLELMDGEEDLGDTP